MTPTIEIDENAGPDVGCLACSCDVETRYGNDYRQGGYLYCAECWAFLVWGL